MLLFFTVNQREQRLINCTEINIFFLKKCVLKKELVRRAKHSEKCVLRIELVFRNKKRKRKKELVRRIKDSNRAYHL
jgi:hypothetical protein